MEITKYVKCTLYNFLLVNVYENSKVISVLQFFVLNTFYTLDHAMHMELSLHSSKFHIGYIELIFGWSEGIDDGLKATLGVYFEYNRKTK